MTQDATQTATQAAAPPHMKRNVGLLATCQALFNTSTGVMLAVSALVGFKLAPESQKWLATTPHAVQWISTACFAIPVAIMMRRLGRKNAFVFSALFGIAGALVAAGSIFWQNFWVFMLATIIFGGFTAASQHYRFAAAEVASEAFRSRSISLVIGGGVVAAILGPEIAKWTHTVASSWMEQDAFSRAVAFICGPGALNLGSGVGDADPYQFAGTFLVVALVPIVLIGIVSMVRFPPVPEPDFNEPPRSAGQLLGQPGFIVAVMCAVIGWGIMVFMMAATPLAMTAQFGLTTENAMLVTQLHMLGMFAPSFVTGWLIARYGLLNILLCGLALSTMAALVGLTGGTMTQFLVANVFVGSGWNFLFVGGTALLTHCYRPVEREKAQGINDFLVFGTVAIFSGAAGWVQTGFGWTTVCIVMLPFIAIVAVAVAWLKFTPGAAPDSVSDARRAIPAAAAE